MKFQSETHQYLVHLNLYPIYYYCYDLYLMFCFHIKVALHKLEQKLIIQWVTMYHIIDS